MASVVQAIVGLLMIPVLFALTSATLSEAGYVLNYRTYGVGLNHWIPIGIAAYAVGFVFLEKTLLGGLFRWEGVEALWRKAIGKRAHPVEQDPGHEQPPQPAKALRVVPYCVPIYAIGAIIIVGMMYWAWRMKHYPEVFGFVLGFFYAHHLAWIGKDIRKEHPDIRVAGNILTPAIVYLVNVEIMLVILALMVNRGRLWIDVNRETFELSREMIRDFFDWLRRML